MTSPTTTVLPASPSAARCSAPTAVGVRSRSAAWSVRTRLISSGMARLKERSPASRWATGMCSLTAARAAASVEFVSP